MRELAFALGPGGPVVGQPRLLGLDRSGRIHPSLTRPMLMVRTAPPDSHRRRPNRHRDLARAARSRAATDTEREPGLTNRPLGVAGGCPEFRGTSVAARSVRRRSRAHRARRVRHFWSPRFRGLSEGGEVEVAVDAAELFAGFDMPAAHQRRAI